MTDGTVTQKPKYDCIACGQEGPLQADELRVFDGECWCSDCWEIHSECDKRWDQLDRFAAVPVAFDEDAALTLAERMLCIEIDEQLADDIIRYAQKLHTLYAAPSALPEGYAILPKELTAENGAKSILIGEFYSEIVVPCPDCEGGDGSEDYDCGFCNSSGTVTERVPVSWTTIKEIWRKAAIALAAHRQQGWGES